MATFVLVHPAWFGGWCWRKVVPLLRASGHDVITPTLTGLGEQAHLAHPGVDLETHVEDVANVLAFEDVDDGILVGTSSSGAVITGVADRVPERLAQLVYLDAFVPENGQSVLDLVPPDRRPAMESLVEAEGFGWLLPRFAAVPWEEFVPKAWQVTDEVDLAWMLPRLRPTPFGHFTGAVRRANAAAERVPRVYVRSHWPHPGFDRHVETARRAPEWRVYELDASHLPYVTSPNELVSCLVEVAAGGNAVGHDGRLTPPT